MATITATKTPDDADGDQPIDATIRLITPERVLFTYPLAGPSRRGLAYLIDAMIIVLTIGCVFALSLLATWGNAAGIGVAYALTFGVTWGYGVVCEGCFNGQTAGKRLVGIRVMTIQGVPITGSQAAIRNLVGTVDGPVPFVFVPGLLSMLVTRRFQRLGDLAAGTMVVIEEAKVGGRMVRVNDEAVMALLPLLPMRVAANPDQARALSDYVKHRGRFSEDRREEIARHLAGPIKARYALPESGSGDAVLCAYYHRVFLGD